MSKTIATVTSPALGCRDGEVKVTSFVAGDEVTGELADAFIAMGKAKAKAAAGKAPAPENKTTAPPETKAGS